eukprot:IDg2119t1
MSCGATRSVWCSRGAARSSGVLGLLFCGISLESFGTLGGIIGSFRRISAWLSALRALLKFLTGSWEIDEGSFWDLLLSLRREPLRFQAPVIP